jgi:NADH-quinone oxidoreductase subunit B
MLMDAILKLRDTIEHTRLGANRDREITEREQAALRRAPLRHPRRA